MKPWGAQKARTQAQRFVAELAEMGLDRIRQGAGVIRDRARQIESGDLRCSKNGLLGCMKMADCPMSVYEPGTDESERVIN